MSGKKRPAHELTLGQIKAAAFSEDRLGLESHCSVLENMSEITPEVLPVVLKSLQEILIEIEADRIVNVKCRIVKCVIHLTRDEPPKNQTVQLTSAGL